MKTHPLNVSYLVIGLVFLGISGSWALLEDGVIGAADIGWLVPVSLVVAGGIGLVAAVAKSLTRRDEPGPAHDAVSASEMAGKIIIVPVAPVSNSNGAAMTPMSRCWRTIALRVVRAGRVRRVRS